MADERVRDVQNWLNNTYGDNPNWVQVTEDGQTGYYTVKALIRALQIELEIAVDGTFGNGTKNSFDTRFPDGLSKNTDASNQKTKNIIAIVNGGFWCRGIEGERNDRYVFGDLTEAGIKLMKSQLLGNTETTGEIKGRDMKAILTTDAYVVSKNGDSTIREIQQQINRKYLDILGSYMATDGIYERNMNTAIIKMIQYEIGVDVDGGWGEGTKSALPVLGPGSSKKNLIYILQYLLYLNGFDPNGFDGGFGNGVTKALKSFQTLMKLDIDGYCGRQVWSALVVSCGDTARSADACDTRFEITPERAKVLKDNEYKIVGRYINNNTFNGLREGELQVIFNAGLKAFFIYQENIEPKIERFNFAKGVMYALNASALAKKHKLPQNTVIYFAVDLDVYENQISSHIIPFFKGINGSLDSNFQVGIYGPREVCRKVSEANLSVSSFVSDMSSGYSCNVGKKIPDNWNYDQFKKVNNINNDFDIDKVGYSGKIEATDKLHSGNYDCNIYENQQTYEKVKEIYEFCEQYSTERQLNLSLIEKNILVLQFLRESVYKDEGGFEITVGKLNDDWIKYIKEKTNNFDTRKLYFYKNTSSAGRIGIGLVHSSVTLESLLNHNSNLTYKELYYNDLNGWAGDLLQAVGEYAKNVGFGKDTFSEERLYDILGYDADDEEFKYFPQEDFLQDIDVLNMFIPAINKPIYTVYKEYYMTDEQSHRFTNFVHNLAVNNILPEGITLESSPYDIIYSLASRYLSGTGDLLADILSWLFDIRKLYFYDKYKYSDPAAKAFARKISDLVKSETTDSLDC